MQEIYTKYLMRAFGDLKFEPLKFDSEDRHQLMMSAIEKYAKPIPQKNLTPVELVTATRRTKLVLMLLPQWAYKFPPYNLARLGSTAKAAGYETHIWDLNINAQKRYNQGKWTTIDFDPWHGARDWHWQSKQYFIDLHSYMLPIMEEYLDRIGKLQPDLIGFTLYYSNLSPTLWMSAEIKRRWPHIKIVVGGSAVHTQYFQSSPDWDFVINGEGENMLLQLLDDIEAGKQFNGPMIFRQPESQRVDLDSRPPPDYSFFNFGDYGIPNGVNSELSRGCTAKCTFCEETHFYRYTQRRASSVLQELVHLYENHGINCIYFIDSLVNGNLNELRAFSKGVVAAGMKLHWTGYARCDGRMDLDYYKDLADSGCVALNYGCESGSQRVLDDIDKRVSIDEMEQNFRHGKATGVEAYTNWIVAFPTEKPQDFSDTMNLIWRNRNNNITVIAPGQGFFAGLDTIVGQNKQKFGLSESTYQGMWIRSDLTLSKLHRNIRVKSFNIFLDHLKTEQPVLTGKRVGLKDHYDIRFHDPDLQLEIEYEQFDYNIINTGLGEYADSAANEIWPLFRMLWRTRGGFNATVRFDRTQDAAEFGTGGATLFDATYIFNITKDGQWWSNFTMKFDQGPNAWWLDRTKREMTNASVRAWRLAHPGKSDPNTRAVSDDEIRAEHDRLRLFDLSFEHNWQSNGHW